MNREHPPSATPWPRRKLWLAGLAVAAAALAAHGAMLGRALVWDDLLILRQLELAGRWRLFAPDPFGFVRPGKTALFSALHAAFGARAWGYELAGLAALLTAVLLFWRLAGRLLGPAGALAAALVFAVHPLHVEGAGWAAASNGAWMLIFALGYYLLLLGARMSPSASPPGGDYVIPGSADALVRSPAPWAKRNSKSDDRFSYLSLTLCFLAALLMKEDAIILPLTGCLLLFAAGRRPTRPLLTAMALQLALAGAFLAWTRAHAAAAGQSLAPLPYAPWIVSLAAPRFILSEILYFIWPFHWAYYREVRTDPAPFFSLMALGWLAAVGLGVWVWRNRKLLSIDPQSAIRIPQSEERTGASALPVIFILFSVVALLPTSNLIPLGNDPFGVRYLIHGGLGLALLAGWCVERIGSGTVPRGLSPISPFRILLFAWLASAVVFANLYHRVWSSEERLFTRLAAVNPRAKYKQLLAQLAYGGGRWTEAEALARRALAAEPACADARIVLGMALSRQGKPGAALAEWLAVESAQPGNTAVAIHLADFYDTRHTREKRPRDFELAEYYYRIAAGSPRTDAETAYVNWGLLWAVNGQPAKAIGIWEDGLKRFPNSRELRVNLAVARRQAQN